MPQLWALLVAIDEYKDSNRNPASGALTDLDHVFEFLIDNSDMGVPESHIRRLRDAEATRAGIILNFREHLIENPAITKGDAILFYFSGHGSFVKAPAGWTVVKGAQDDSDDMVEVILPYDEGYTYPYHDTPTYAIPDRTLAALIDLAAARHGDNITIILDCCSSGHGTRAEKPLLFQGEVVVNRSIETDKIAPLPPTLDHDLVPPIATRTNRRGRFRALGSNHVLLAACKAREKAQGTKGFGGFFTTLWLWAMKDSNNVCPRTSAEVVRFINDQLEELWTRQGIRWDQHPQCEGSTRDRIIFEETMINAAHFPTTPVISANGELEVAAGKVHGIKEGDGFDIYGHTASLQEEWLGNARAIRVDGRTCIVQASSDWLTQPSHNTFAVYTATIIQKLLLGYIIHIVPGTPPNDVEATREKLYQALLHAEDISEAKNPDTADLEVRIGSGGAITLHRLDPLMHHLPNFPPRIAGTELDPKNLNTVFCGIARFNYQLSLTNHAHPFANKVVFEMLRFTRAQVDNSDDNLDRGVFPLREVDGPVQITHSKVGFEVTDNDEYAIVLRNNTNVHLHVQVWCFDPDEYSISPIYQPASDAQAILPGNGGSLQIGASTEHPWPLTYYVPDGGTSTTLFAKVFLTDEPVELRPLQQPALVGPDAGDHRDHLAKAVETRGLWDTILQPITVVKEQDEY